MPRSKEQVLEDIGIMMEALRGLQFHVAEHGVWEHWQTHQMKRWYRATQTICDLYYTGTFDPDPKDHGRLHGAENCPASLFFNAVIARKPGTYGDALDYGMAAGYSREQTQGFLASAHVLGIIDITAPGEKEKK